MRKSRLLALGASCAMLAGLAAPAASPAAISSSISIRFVDRPGADVFRGRVSSPNDNCIEERDVSLFRVLAGDDERIDGDESEDDGTWAIDVEGDPARGRYYVRITPRPLGADRCARAHSPIIQVDG